MVFFLLIENLIFSTHIYSSEILNSLLVSVRLSVSTLRCMPQSFLIFKINIAVYCTVFLLEDHMYGNEV